MALSLRRRPAAETAPPADVTEAARPDLPDVTRTGFEYGVPIGGTVTNQQARATTSSRTQALQELYQAYLACPWVNTCVDTIARMVTAGGLTIDPDDEDTDPDNVPPLVAHLRHMLRFVNEREDAVQLVRSAVIDLLIFGDCFFEVAYTAGVPVALWTLDATTMTVKCDEHGTVTGYVQAVDGQRTATFDADEVIHVSLDAPRGGVYGVSPVQKLMLPITAYLFTAAVLKENYRRGDPPQIAVDLGRATNAKEADRWATMYQTHNLGARAIGQPIVTRVHSGSGGDQPPVKELSQRKVADATAALKMFRDEIVSGLGLTPASVGIIESGNLGSGSGESQARTLHYGTIIPVQNLVLEKFTYALLARLGVAGWAFRFGEIDYRDSKTVEDIRDQRLRNGSWTLNQYLADIGEEPVPYGDVHVLVDRQNLVLWSDLPAFSAAQVASKQGVTPLDVSPVPPADAPSDAPGADVSGPDVGSKESLPVLMSRLEESWAHSLRARKRAALKALR